MKNNTYIWAGAGIGITMLVAYLYAKSTVPTPSNSQAQQDESDNYNTPTRAGNTKSVHDTVRDNVTDTAWKLGKGSTGKEVERLQIWLLRNHGWKGGVTGIYDEQTDRLVQKRFGKDHVDKATYTKYKMGIPIHKQIKTYGSCQQKRET